MKKVAIIQARCGSTRFPNKVFINIDGFPLIWHVVNRLSYAKKIDEIVVATTINTLDDSIVEWCNKNDVVYYRGSETDVLNRYYNAAVKSEADVIIRITADDPFKEPAVIDKVINTLLENYYDLVTNNYPPSFPEGLDCEAFTFETLEKMEKSTDDAFEREHVTQYAYHNPNIFRIGNVNNEIDLSSYRWTIDNKEDYEMVNLIYKNRDKSNKGLLCMDEILTILRDNPDISRINSNVKRSAMYQ